MFGSVSVFAYLNGIFVFKEPLQGTNLEYRNSLAEDIYVVGIVRLRIERVGGIKT